MLLAPLVRGSPIVFGHTWGTGLREYGTAIVVDANGNVLLAGTQYDPATSLYHDFVAKFDAQGNFVWNRLFPWPSGGYVDMSLAPGGDVYVFGSKETVGPSQNGTGNATFASAYVARISAAGSLVYAFNVSEIAYAERIATDPSTGGFSLVGQEYYYPGRSFVASFLPDGTLRWARNASMSVASAGFGIGVDGSGSTYLLYNRGNSNMGLTRFGSQGTILAQRAIGSYYPYYVDALDLQVTPGGNVYVLGTACCNNLLLGALTSNVTPVWTETSSPGGYVDSWSRLAVLSDGSLAAFGYSFTSFSYENHMNLYRYAPSGAFLAGSSYVSPQLNQQLGTMFSVDAAAPLANGGIALAGTTFGPSPTSSTDVNVTVSSFTEPWVTDSAAFSPTNLTLADIGAPLGNPSVPMDNFNELAQEQAWYGVTNVPAAKVAVSVSVSQSSPSSSSVTLTATASGGHKPYTFAWSFGDGTFGTGATPAHTYPGTGLYLAQVTAKDSQNNVGYGSAIVTVTGPPTVLRIEQYPPTDAYNGNSIWFYADAIDPDGGTLSSFSWSFGDGGSAFSYYNGANHVYASPGNYTLTVTVTDSDQGLSTSASMNVMILPRPDMPPIASFYYNPYNPTVGAAVSFYAYYSYDPDGSIVSYRWFFGDGTSYNANYSYASHAYAAAGNYTVTLIVTDNAGLIGFQNQSLFVQPDQPPVAGFVYYPSVPSANQSVCFQAYYYSYDPDGYIVSWSWDFGDGSSPGGNNTGNGTNQGPYVCHVYAHFGSYLVTLTVTDNANLSASANQTVHVNAPPVAVITPSRSVGKVGTLVVFSANASTDPDDSIVNYTWYLGDGTYASGPWVSHVYSSVGQYTVTLRVIDAYGAMSMAALAFPVTTPKSPMAIITWSPPRPLAGQTSVYFNGSNSLDPDGAITTYIWEFGDGMVAHGMTVSHTYANAGTYTLELVVLDEDGLSDRDVQTITVVAPSKGVVAAASTDAPLAGARVVLTMGGAVALDVSTGADGSFSLGGLAPGTYALTISVAGYRSFQGNLVWDGFNGDLGTWVLSPLAPSAGPLSAGLTGFLGGVAAVAIGVVAIALRRRRARKGPGGT